jgi:hypothetical protein
VLCLTDEGRLLIAAADPMAPNLDSALLQALPQAQRDPLAYCLRCQASSSMA